MKNKLLYTAHLWSDSVHKNKKNSQKTLHKTLRNKSVHELIQIKFTSNLSQLNAKHLQKTYIFFPFYISQTPKHVLNVRYKLHFYSLTQKMSEIKLHGVCRNVLKISCSKIVGNNFPRGTADTRTYIYEWITTVTFTTYTFDVLVQMFIYLS